MFGARLRNIVGMRALRRARIQNRPVANKSRLPENAMRMTNAATDESLKHQRDERARTISLAKRMRKNSKQKKSF